MTTDIPQALDPNARAVVTLVRLRPDLRGHLDLSLWSELEGKVPYGEVSKFFNLLLEQYFLGTEPILPYYVQQKLAAAQQETTHG